MPRKRASSSSTELTSKSLIRAEPHRFAQIGVDVALEVQDSGAGIPEEDMPRVFTAFEQTETARGRTDSTGLGLLVTLGMAEAMGGHSTATSTGREHGSTFRLVLEAGSGKEPELRMASLSGFAA